MYYNSNSNDYYNSYKKELAELEAYRKEESIYRIIKLILLFLTFVLLLVAAFYLYKYFNPTLNEQNSALTQKQMLSEKEVLPAIVIREEELPQSVQLRESSMQSTQNIQRNATDSTKTGNQNSQYISTMNEKDIALIVQTIMTQMNIKKEVSLEKQLEKVANKHYETKSLEKGNHYNKVVLTKNVSKEVKNPSLMELSNNLNNIISEGTNITSSYTQAIKKEVVFRENEMRIIIVQKGDTLSRIAKKAYGNSDAYTKIFSANPEIIKNPNQIFIGQRLRIPS
ncbi:MAG: Ferric siderophore transport system, periplasmic binding protein TonB [uncultured Sulfurovum sp.]|uniref:Ferric siderophore transport system, periplasmic binding protein TonB n=1 Tax=uncultured Sulfurovum sp. TaxID=269237 RepID=A0A6S6S1D3_9BACT|nr:MAG: Ferric siderophore transport system, periplasmic binding protein TonB [uncultured Sulfurovum sp.]